MKCSKFTNLEKRIILIPLDHSEREDLLIENLPELFDYCDNLNIYWESISRYDEIESNKKIGLEDSKLLSLFEIILFVISNQDPRIHSIIYEGTGTKSKDTSSEKTISQQASNAAKGSQAVINLKSIYSQLDPDLKMSIDAIDIDELIDQRNNNQYIEEYNLKLFQVYLDLMNSLKDQGYIDFNFITESLNRVSNEESLFDSTFYATNLKEYLKGIRDVSNSIYIEESMDSSKISNAICCIGGAHIEELRLNLVDLGIKVNVVSLSEYKNKDQIKAELLKFFLS